MHEVSIMEDILDTVFTHPEVEPARRVTAIRVKIGSLSSIVEESLRFAFDSLSIGTKADGAQLIVEQVQTTCKCNQCGNTYTPDGPGYICPACGAMDVDIINGRELQLTSVEVDE